MASSRLIFQLMIFSFLLNLSTGIMMHLIPDLFLTGPGNTNDFSEGISYDNDKVNIYLNETYRNQTVTPSSQINGGSGFFSSILDAITGGYFSKVVTLISDAIWGFPNMLDNIFGSYMDNDLRLFIFGGMKATLSLMYIFGIIWLWTGRNVLKESL